MKLVLIFLFYLSSTYANVDKASTLYNEKKFKEASELFYDRYLAAPFDTKNTFNLALSKYHEKQFNESLIYFKNVALSKSSLNIVSYLFMAKIYFELKKYKASTATLGKAMSFKNIPEPIYMSMLDLWELLNRKNLKYESKGKEFLNTIDVDKYLSNLESLDEETLSEKEVSNINKALEFFQLAWVLNPEGRLLENIVRCYLILGDENKATRLLLLIDEKSSQENLAKLLSDRKDQINRQRLKKVITYETPNGVEFQFSGGVINDSNPVTRKRIQNDPIEETRRAHLDLGLNLNPFIENDFILQIKTRFISDRMSSDPITAENDDNNSALLLSSLEIPSYVLSKTTRLKVSSNIDHYKMNKQTILTTTGVNFSFEKYFSRYATFLNTWYKINNGVALDFYDGQNWGGEAGVYRYTKRSYFGLGGGYRKEKAGSFGAESFSFYEKYLTMRGSRKLSKNLSLELGVNLALKTYYSVREDEKINFFSSLAYELLPMTSLKVKYDFFDNGSTLSQYDFNQHQIGFHLVGDYF